MMLAVEFAAGALYTKAVRRHAYDDEVPPLQSPINSVVGEREMRVSTQLFCSPALGARPLLL